MRIWILSLLLMGFSLPAGAARFPRVSFSLSSLRGKVERGLFQRLRHVPGLGRIPAASGSQVSSQVPFLTPVQPLANLQVKELSARALILPSLALPLDSRGFVLGSGFVIRSASGRLYAVSSYHVTGSAGKPASVRLFGPDGKAVDFTGLKVSAGGSYGINAPDVSLIELPARAERLVRPLGVAAQPPQAGSELVMWGRPYDAPDFELAPGLAVSSVQGMKITLNRTEEIEFLEGMCGAPVLDENGLVTGIYGGRGGADEALFAIDARKSLSWLLKNYEGGKFTPYTFKVRGQIALELEEGESLALIEHRSPSGEFLDKIDFSTYPHPLDANLLEEAFRDLRSLDVLVFTVNRGVNFSRFVFFKVP